MQERWRYAPWWVLPLVTGTPFAVLMALFSLVQHEPWPAAVVGGALGEPSPGR